MKFSIEGWTQLGLSDDLTGKIVTESYYDGEKYILVFGNEFLVIGIEKHYYGEVTLDASELDVDDAIIIGIVTQETYDTWKAEDQKRRQTLQEIEERNALSRLKAKYEGTK